MGLEWEQIKLRKNDRGVLVGATGSGKTFLAQYLVNDEAKPYSVVYDAKISDSIGRWKGQRFISDFDELIECDEPRLIFRPNYVEAVDALSQDRFFEWVYLRQHTRLFVDEAYAVTGGANPSFHFQACLTRGRERGISTLVATQRPYRIPLVTLSEAEHYYVFRLQMLKDRQRVEELTGISAEAQTELEEFEFYYFNVFSGAYTGSRDKQAPPKKLKVNPISQGVK